MDDDVDAKLINMMGFIQLFNGNRPDYNPDAWRECWENRHDMAISEILNILKSCFHDTNAQYYSDDIHDDKDNPVWSNWLCMITASLDPVKQPETVKACMRLYCMIHDEIVVNEFIEFINKIHPNPIMPAFKTMPNELDDGHPMEYAIQHALMRTSS